MSGSDPQSRRGEHTPQCHSTRFAANLGHLPLAPDRQGVGHDGGGKFFRLRLQFNQSNQCRQLFNPWWVGVGNRR